MVRARAVGSERLPEYEHLALRQTRSAQYQHLAEACEESGSSDSSLFAARSWTVGRLGFAPVAALGLLPGSTVSVPKTRFAVVGVGP
jgi:hypothetical protein